jgi:glucose/arabinose dehydrogenase
VKARLLLCVAALAVAACGPEPISPKRQIGAQPYLPEPHQYLLPPMHVVSNVGWNGKSPQAAAGLKVQALSRDFKNPRSLYVLPNGDILVVESDGPKEPVSRPKQFIMNVIESKAHSSVKADQRILLRDTNGDGMPDERHVFLEHLHSPFGVVLVGSDLYVANTDAIIRFPYQEGQTGIAAPGTKLTDLPGGPIDHHWTKSLTASPDGSKLYAGVGSSARTAWKRRKSAPRFGRSTARQAPIACMPPACAIPTA